MELSIRFCSNHAYGAYSVMQPYKCLRPTMLLFVIFTPDETYMSKRKAAFFLGKIGLASPNDRKPVEMAMTQTLWPALFNTVPKTPDSRQRHLRRQRQMMMRSPRSHRDLLRILAKFKNADCGDPDTPNPSADRVR